MKASTWQPGRELEGEGLGWSKLRLWTEFPKFSQLEAVALHRRQRTDSLSLGLRHIVWWTRGVATEDWKLGRNRKTESGQVGQLWTKFRPH